MKFIYAIFFSLLILLNPVVAYVKADANTEIIKTYEEDITGDGLKETITLKGILFSEKSTYYQNIWADIESVYSRWSIPYGGGYEPEINFINLDQGETVNLFFNSKTNDGQFPNHYLHTLNNGSLKKIALPQTNYVNGKFTDKFTVSITITPDGRTKNVPVNADIYIKENIYNVNGELVQPVSAIVDPLIFEKHYISQEQGYGLKSYQTVSEPVNNEPLGRIETIWYFENDKWIIVKNDWISTK